MRQAVHPDLRVHTTEEGIVSIATRRFVLIVAAALCALGCGVPFSAGSASAALTHDSLPAPGEPSVSGESFSAVAQSEVVLRAQINPGNTETTFHVEYGTSETYGNDTTESESVGADETSHPVSVHITGLAAGTTYHFRFVATNAVATVNGSDTTFTTYSQPEPSHDCPNETRREEQNVPWLPDCRAYEMVSPLDKNGGNIVGNGHMVESSADGNRAAFYSWAGFGDSDGSGATGWTGYLATRGVEGWKAHGITPLPPRDGFQFVEGATLAPFMSESLEKAEFEGSHLPGVEGAIPKVVNLYMENTETRALEAITHEVGEEFVAPLALAASARGVSDDLGVTTFETAANLLPEATGSASKLYEWDHGTLRLAGVLPDGSVPAEGSSAPPYKSSFDSRHYLGTVSRDGSRVPFQSPSSGPHEPQLYLRRDGTSTAWVSQSEASTPNPEPHNVRFAAMSADGDKVLFTSTDRLLDSDTSSGEAGLYMYTDGPDPEVESNLTLLGRIKLDGAERTLVGLSEDANRVYFYTGETEDFPQAGIYLWDEGNIHFVAATSSAPAPYTEALVSADGRTLAFVSADQLTNRPVEAFGGELYVYNEGTETLRCASCRPTGAPTTSPVALEPDATNAGTTLNTSFYSRFLTSSGKYVFFSTAEPLVAQDTNSLTDAYEYNTLTEEVSLLSTGTGDYGVWVAGASTNGNDVFLLTQQSLIAQDTDSLVDLYDVRVGGGFPGPKPETGGCVGDECQGTPGAVPSFNTASGFTGLGNIASSAEKAVLKKAVTRVQKLTQALKACKRRKPKKARRSCEARARKRYGKTMRASIKHSKRGVRGGNRG